MIIKLFHIVLPKTSICKKGQTKWMFFLIDLLEKYNTIWNKVISDIRKEFDSKPVYNK